MSKPCKKCGSSDFDPRGRCRPCHNAIAARSYAKNRKAILAKNRKPPSPAAEKVCLLCGGGDFYPNRKNGLQCRPCNNAYERERYAANIDRERQKVRERYRNGDMGKHYLRIKKANAALLERQPHYWKKSYPKNAGITIGAIYVKKLKDFDAFCLSQRANRAKRQRNKAVLSLERAFDQLKEICMSDTMTFQFHARTMSTEELFAEFNACTVRVSEGLYRMAVIWVELENRGQDLSVIKTPFRSFFPAIASGQMLPDVALQYGGNIKKVELVSKLVVEDQRKIVGDDARVALLTRTPDGGTAVTQVKPAEMRLTEARQVFGDGRIRTPDEQAKFLPKEPGPQVAAPSAAEVNLEEFDLLAELSQRQCVELANLAAAKKMTPAAFVVDLLIRTRAISAPSRRLASGTVRSFSDLSVSRAPETPARRAALP